MCNALTERAVQGAIRSSAIVRSDDVYRALGCEPQCGCCRPMIDGMIAELRCPIDA